MGEPRDFQLLIGLAKRKYNNDERAVDLLKRIAATQVEFHRGHSQLVEFLVAGQRAVCFTCYAHHFPPRIKKGAPIQALLSEGVGEVGGAVSILKGARTRTRRCSGRVGPSAKKANECTLRPGKLPPIRMSSHWRRSGRPPPTCSRSKTSRSSRSMKSFGRKSFRFDEIGSPSASGMRSDTPRERKLSWIFTAE
jgi:hypothetical protein